MGRVVMCNRVEISRCCQSPATMDAATLFAGEGKPEPLPAKSILSAVSGSLPAGHYQLLAKTSETVTRDGAGLF